MRISRTGKCCLRSAPAQIACGEIRSKQPPLPAPPATRRRKGKTSGRESWRELSGRSVRGAHFQGVPLKNDLAQRERYLTARNDATPIGQWPEADGFDLFERLPVRVGRTAAAQQ